MKYNSEKTIWRPKEDLEKNPSYIDADKYEKYLSEGISKRVKEIKEDCNLTSEDLYNDKHFRIDEIEQGKYPTSSKKKICFFYYRYNPF